MDRVSSRFTFTQELLAKKMGVGDITGRKASKSRTWQWATEIEGGTSTSIKTPVYTQDHIFVGNHNDILIYDNDGNLVKEMDSVPNMYWSLRVAKDGQLYVNYIVGESPVSDRLVSVDWESGTLGEEIIPCWKNEYEYFVIGHAYGYDYDFLLCNTNSLVGWNVGDEFCTVLTNFSVEGEDLTSLYQVIAVGEDTYWA